MGIGNITGLGKNGTAFPDHDKPTMEWLEWTPKIALPADGRGTPP